jgi:16S rRNA (guanine527-N7)-methyltransferase
VFYVEQNILPDWLRDNNVEYDPAVVDRLVRYAHLLDEYNKKTNITGLKNVEDIIHTLIIMSLNPLIRFEVPRGTSFVDVGTGSGIPGIILSIWFPGFSGVLIEANGKKVEFLHHAIDSLKCDNVKVINGRVEELGHQAELRSGFDWCFTRAFGPLYYSIEFGLPLIKPKGLMYIYSSLLKEGISPEMHAHINRVGGSVLDPKDHQRYGVGEEGLLFVKNGETADCYPRRFAIVKRDAAKIEKNI